MPNESKYYTYQQASLSQKAADKNKILERLSGSDTKLSDSIAILTFLRDKKMIDATDADFFLELLDLLRLSHFATSEKTNEISKLGFMMPKAEDIISSFDEEG